MTPASEVPPPLPSSGPSEPIIVVCTSPKGGSGKSTILRAVAVGAAMEGRRVTIIDYDAQKTSHNWVRRRAALEGVAPVSGTLGSWRGLKDEVRQAIETHDIVLIDTPPSVEEHMTEVSALLRAAHYVLIPTGPQFEDRDSVKPWMTVIRHHTKNVAFVLNCVKQNTRSLRNAKLDLVRVGKLCPIEIPDYEDVHLSQEDGYSVVEISDASGHAQLAAVWNFVKSELEIQ